MARKRRRPLPYKEGTWFAVPLRTEGYAIGVVARHNARGVVFGYFFGPILSRVPERVEYANFSAGAAVLCGRFGDLHFLEERWVVIQDGNWRRSEWPLPSFVRVDEATGAATMSVYSEDTLTVLHEERCDAEMVKTHPYDRLMGAGAVEIRLTKLLEDAQTCRNMQE